MNTDDLIKAILALGTGLGALVFGYQKYSVAQSKKGVLVAGDDAQIAQMLSIRAYIESAKAESAEFRAQLVIFERRLHIQHRTIVRMEMLLRQFSSLVRQHGIEVPGYMQKELDELLESDTDRHTSDARGFP